MTHLEKLIAMQKLFSSPEKWTQKAYARPIWKEEELIATPVGSCYCVLGAGKAIDGVLDKPANESFFSEQSTAQALGFEDQGCGDCLACIEWNDHPDRTFSDITERIKTRIKELSS